MIEYKGYVAKVDYEHEDRVFVGRVVNVKGLISFEGNTPDEIEANFRAAIEDYIENCKGLGIKPLKPVSGNFVVRLEPELHQALILKAKAEHKSLNSLVRDKLAMAI